MVPVHFEDWGMIPYAEALEKQKKLQSLLVQFKLENRENKSQGQSPNQYLIFCEHPPVYTLGNRAHMENLLISEEDLKTRNIELFPIRRGGDITFHGPGQIVAYPILDLEYFFTDIHKYMRFLEEAVIRTLKDYGLESGRIDGLTGVWIDWEMSHRARKISAEGVHCSRWVTMHGLALNVNTDLQYFENIIPCGIQDKGVTSMSRELNQELDIIKVKSRLKNHFASLFSIDWV